jgi:DNA-binding response OmpR family regulator
MTSVLLLDIDLPLIDLLKRKLEQEGFRVMVGSSHDIFTQLFDLVILGEPLKETKMKYWFKSNVPMIMLSHRDEMIGKPKGLSQLKLPFRPSELMEMVHQKVLFSFK